MGQTIDTAMEFEEMPLHKIVKKPKKETSKMSENSKPAVVKKGNAPVKEPASIKLSTIWKAAVYSFAVIGVVLSVMYVNQIVNGIVDSRAEAKMQEMLKAQPATQPQSKVNQ